MQEFWEEDRRVHLTLSSRPGVHSCRNIGWCRDIQGLYSDICGYTEVVSGHKDKSLASVRRQTQCAGYK